MHHLARYCCALLAVLTFWLVPSVSQTASAQTCTPPPAGMTAWYPGDGNARDIQGGNNGTPVGSVTFAPGKVNQAFNLNRTGYVQVPDSPSLRPTSQLTLDAWVKITDVASERIIDKITAASPDGYLLDIINARPRLIIGSTVVTSTNQIPLNTFVHLAGTYDGAQLRLYVNGLLDTSAALTGAIPTNNFPLRIGADSNGENQFNGLIDEVEIFNRALAQTEIQAIVNAGEAGKCKAAQSAGNVVISEFRWDGPGGANDEFIELYNTTNSDITVAGRDGSGGWAVAADDATGTRFVVPNGTVIPARGHFLIANSNGYSLSSYPAGVGTNATPDGTYTVNIPANTGIALFDTDTPANFSAATRLDAVGSAGGVNPCGGPAAPTSSALYREGAGLAIYGSSFANLQYSLVRDLASGRPKDTGDNSSDFRLVENSVNFGICGQNLAVTLRAQLGAPGPENLSSPVNRSDKLKATVIASCVAPSAAPNRERVNTSYTDVLSNTGTYANGTLRIRRRFTNMTGGNVTRLRFRITDITTAPAPTAGTADLRAISSGDESAIANPCPGQPTTSQGLTLEQPPTQANGGGLNSSLSAGSIALATPLAAGDSITVNFLLGVRQTGTFRFFVTVEALPGLTAPTNSPAQAKAARGEKVTGGPRK